MTSQICLAFVAGDQFYVISTIANIQREIIAAGPVEGALNVYADFVSYKSGRAYVEVG